MLVFDLQFRLQCQGCNRRGGFRITIFDERTRGDSSKRRLERVILAFHGGKLGLGEDDAVLGDFGLERFQPLFHSFQIVALRHAANVGRRNGKPALS